MALPSGALPVGTLMYPPAAMIRSNAPRSTTRSLITGNALARHGSMYSSCAVLEMPHAELAHRGGGQRAVRDAVDHESARSANALAAIVLERDRLFAFQDQALVHHVQHLQQRHVRIHVVRFVAHHASRLDAAFFCRQMCRISRITCSSAGWDARIRN